MLLLGRITPHVKFEKATKVTRVKTAYPYDNGCTMGSTSSCGAFLYHEQVHGGLHSFLDLHLGCPLGFLDLLVVEVCHNGCFVLLCSFNRWAPDTAATLAVLEPVETETSHGSVDVMLTSHRYDMMVMKLVVVVNCGGELKKRVGVCKKTTNVSFE